MPEHCWSSQHVELALCCAQYQAGFKPELQRATRASSISCCRTVIASKGSVIVRDTPGQSCAAVGIAGVRSQQPGGSRPAQSQACDNMTGRRTSPDEVGAVRQLSIRTSHQASRFKLSLRASRFALQRFGASLGASALRGFGLRRVIGPKVQLWKVAEATESHWRDSDSHCVDLQSHQREVSHLVFSPTEQQRTDAVGEHLELAQ